LAFLFRPKEEKMKFRSLFTSGLVTLMLVAAAQGAVVSTTLHGDSSHALDSYIATGDLIAGQMGVELAPLYGWHPANSNPADQLPAMTDDAGLLASGLTGLLNDFPTPGTPAKTLQYSFPATDIAGIQVLTGNNGGDGRIFSTTVVRYSTDGGSNYSVLGYFQSDPSGTLNNGGSNPRYYSTLVQIADDSSAVLAAGVTDVIFELYAVDNTGGQMRDPFDGVNPFTGIDDTLSAAFVSPLVFELDVIAVPEPAALALLAIGALAIRRR
jgi:hypothetical protein